MDIKTIAWENGSVFMIDQRRLPQKEIYLRYRRYQDVIAAIRNMVIRGAPAIGVAAAMGLALGAGQVKTRKRAEFEEVWKNICADVAKARPTAVNLFWAIQQMDNVVKNNPSLEPEDLKAALLDKARSMLAEDIETNRTMGKWGQSLLADGDVVLTHCNAGALATGGYGTALGVIRAAHEAGKRISVIADETRPFLQGARLTAWELKKCNIPVTVITDNSAGSLLRQGRINAVIVGADRIAANGDVANKIGTYSVAVLARQNKVPFYVAAPESTIDLRLTSGEEIPIEERAAEEVTHFQGKRVVPEGVTAINMAFDVTPHQLVTAIITEKGIKRAPYRRTLSTAQHKKVSKIEVTRNDILKSPQTPL